MNTLTHVEFSQVSMALEMCLHELLHYSVECKTELVEACDRLEGCHNLKAETLRKCKQILSFHDSSRKLLQLVQKDVRELLQSPECRSDMSNAFKVGARLFAILLQLRLNIDWIHQMLPCECMRLPDRECDCELEGIWCTIDGFLCVCTESIDVLNAELLRYDFTGCKIVEVPEVPIPSVELHVEPNYGQMIDLDL